MIVNLLRYPKRLIDLDELRGALGVKINGGSKITSKFADLQATKVHLVNSADSVDRSQTAGERYVTLTHCWGKLKPGQSPQLKLTEKTERRFLGEGIELRELTKVSYLTP